MPSVRHEGALMLVRERPTLLLELLARATDYVPPDGVDVEVESADFTQAIPLERRADLVLLLKRAGANEAALVVEVQLEIDHEKRFAWPLYAASLHAQVRCATQLVVIAPSRRVAAWAREPSPTFYGIAPLVLGPEDVPRVEAVDDAIRSPELAFLSALIHGHRRGGSAILEAAFRASGALDAFRAAHYVDLVFSAHPAAARAAMEAVMTSQRGEFRSEFMRKLNEEGREEGREEGARQALLLVLTGRGIALSDVGSARVEACRDVAALRRWIERAVTATSEDELFAES